MSKQHKIPLGTTEVEAILKALNLEEQRAYVSTLYSIAQDAIKSGCRDLKAIKPILQKTAGICIGYFTIFYRNAQIQTLYNINTLSKQGYPI